MFGTGTRNIGFLEFRIAFGSNVRVAPTSFVTELLAVDTSPAFLCTVEASNPAMTVVFILQFASVLFHLVSPVSFLPTILPTNITVAAQEQDTVAADHIALLFRPGTIQ